MVLKNLNKRGFFFTFDALLASVILLGTLMILTKYYMSEQDTIHIGYLSQDMVTALNTLKTGETNNSWIVNKTAIGNITNPNLTITEQIGQFWAENKTSLAQELCYEMTSGLIEENMGYSVLVNDEHICGANKTNQQTIISSRKMVSGIDKYKPVEGIVAQAHLTSIGNKQYSSYVYFGGFVGQGNITGTMHDIPAGATLQELYMELDAGSDFELFINKQQCNSTLSTTSGNMTADAWNISSCMGHIITGETNNFTISFEGDLSESFIGGGFIKATYLTDQMVQNKTEGQEIKWLPGIKGIINLYSSFYVPGQLNNITINFHYYADITNVTNNTLYMAIGDDTVLSVENPDGENTITLTDANLSSYLDYSSLSLKTVPIRVGFENVSFGYIYVGQADVALITDVSGSMGWRMDNNNAGTRRECDDPGINDSSAERLSVAKCLDKEFARDVVNITGNKVGLIAYSGSTQGSSTLYPTSNITEVDDVIGTSVPQTGYTAGGGTCICCGINSAVDMLMENITRTTVISNGSDGWYYTTDYFLSAPPIDSENHTWYNFSYINESQWSSGGTAVIGSTNGFAYAPAVITDVGSNLTGNMSYADLWEHGNDTAGEPNDFSSGILNYTSNSYGIAGEDDGWDYDTMNGNGPFGYDDNIDYNEIVSGELELDSRTGSPARNRCSGYDCSGAYGISVNITQEIYDIIQSESGSATLSFSYEWDEDTGNIFENADQVWIKARWTSPTSGSHYLGRDLDDGHQGADADPEIATAENPDVDFSGFYAEDLSGWIEGPGMYYLELGGKQYCSWYNEYGTWRFDDIQIAVTNKTNHYYFRKHFNITNTSQVSRGVINILSDDRAIVYLNGELIDEDFEPHTGEYWNRRGKNIPGSYFRAGDNVIAVELINNNLAAKVDLELFGFDSERDKAITVMTDGVATGECARQGTGDASQDAIQAACEAREDYGIVVYAVGFSDGADESALEQIAECGDGIYAKSNNITTLKEFYEDIASSIVSASMHSQTIDVQGDLTDSILYEDSYIEINYTPIVDPPQFGEIDVVIEEKGFDNCTFNVTIPDDIRVTDSKMTSYSSEHWTDALIVNNNVVYNLSYYNDDYTELGDPFIINIPPTLLNTGNNTFYIRTGDHPQNSTGCSLNNTFIYTGMIQSNIPYSQVLSKAEGCNWNVEFDDGSFENISVPVSYNGGNTCSFTSTLIDYDSDDTLDNAGFQLFSQLDFNDDFRVDINFNDMNLFVQSFLVPGVPSMWGPAIIEGRVW